MELFKVQITFRLRDLLALSLAQAALLAKALKPKGPARLDICDLSIHVSMDRPMEWKSLAEVKRSIAYRPYLIRCRVPQDVTRLRDSRQDIQTFQCIWISPLSLDVHLVPSSTCSEQVSNLGSQL
eukprot:s2084_g9.t1